MNGLKFPAELLDLGSDLSHMLHARFHLAAEPAIPPCPTPFLGLADAAALVDDAVQEALLFAEFSPDLCGSSHVDDSSFCLQVFDVIIQQTRKLFLCGIDFLFRRFPRPPPFDPFPML